MHSLRRNKMAQMAMVGAAIGLLITLIISVLIYFSIAPVATPSAAQRLGAQKVIWNQSYNASNTISNQASTFFTIAPIVAIVIVAVVVIGYVQRIGG